MLQRFGNQRLKQYNLDAISDFQKAFETFKQNEDDYQSNFQLLRTLITDHLACYEEKYLMSAAMVYYNMVYGYILHTLATDIIKFFITELTITTKKKEIDERDNRNI